MTKNMKSFSVVLRPHGTLGFIFIPVEELLKKGNDAHGIMVPLEIPIRIPSHPRTKVDQLLTLEDRRQYLRILSGDLANDVKIAPIVEVELSSERGSGALVGCVIDTPIDHHPMLILPPAAKQ